MANNWVIFFYLKEVKWEGGGGVKKNQGGGYITHYF